MTTPNPDTATRARYADLIEQLQSYSDRSCHAAATLIADLLAELDRLADENRALRERLSQAAWVIDSEHGLTERGLKSVLLLRGELDDLALLLAAARKLGGEA